MDKIEVLVDMETNIWACIYRSLNRKRDIVYQGESNHDGNPPENAVAAGIFAGKEEQVKRDGNEEKIKQLFEQDKVGDVNRGIEIDETKGVFQRKANFDNFLCSNQIC